MRTPRIASCTVVLLAMIATSRVAAFEVTCDKNHYILDLPCAPSPLDVAVATDARGNVYFSSPNIVFKLDGQGVLTVVAGNGTPGYAGDGGLATDALLNFPSIYPELAADPIDFGELLGALAVDSVGNLFIADAYNSRVRKVDPNGIITTVAGNGGKGYFGDGGDGDQATDAQITWPQGVAVDAAGNLYASSAYGKLRKVTPDGVIATVTSSNCGGGFLDTGLCAPEGMALAASGNLFVADGYCRVREVTPDGSVGTVAGADARPDPQRGMDFTCGYSGDGGPARDAALEGPFGVAANAIGNLYIADTYNNCIRKVDGAGIITTVAGACGFYYARGYSGDGGPATSAKLNRPHGVAVDIAGNLYIADTDNNRIRKIGLDGIITTIAGDGN
jgi:sugar lactone lactonase YvrE